MEEIIFMSRKNSEMLLLWQNRIEGCSASNLKIKQWCKENGLSAYQYHYWKKKISEIDSNGKSDEVQQVEVNLESQKSEKNEIVNDKPAILHFHDFKIEIPKNFDKESIAEILSAILSMC